MTIHVYTKVNTIKRALEFAQLNMSSGCSVHVNISGIKLPGDSIMSLFSIDLTKWFDTEIKTDDAEKAYALLRKYADHDIPYNNINNNNAASGMEEK